MKKNIIILNIFIILILIYHIYDYFKYPQGFIIKKWNWIALENDDEIPCYFFNIIYITKFNKLQMGFIRVSSNVYETAKIFDIVQYSGKPWDKQHGHYSNGWYFNTLFDNDLSN